MRGQINLGKRWGRRLFVGAVTLGLAAGGYFWGRNRALPEAAARPAAASTETAETSPVPSGRVVAYIYGNVPITREELGEYLIARHGKDKVKHLINKRIIEQAARAKGIDITDAEIGVCLNADAFASGAKTVKEFTDVILKRYNKSPYEWREDVIKPRLVLEKMCRARVTVTREDLSKAFQAHFGQKVDCKMILFPKDDKNQVLNKVWPAVRNSEKEFDHYARIQPSPSLAGVGGHIKPVGRNTTGSDKLEKCLFSLRPGEVSEVLEEPEGLVILKCLGTIPPNTSVTFEQAQKDLEKEVLDKKVAIEIGKMFQELYAQAQVNNLLEPTSSVKDIQRELGVAPRTNNSSPVPGLPPAAAGSVPVPPGGK